MMRSLLFSCSLALLAGGAHSQDLPQNGSPWFRDGQAKIDELLARAPIAGRARNVILFIGDGNGVGTNYANRLFAGQRDSDLGEGHVQPQEAFPYLALVKTYTHNSQTPDSAATGTAMNSGIKVRNTMLNVDAAVVPGDCENVAGNELKTFAEIVTDMGKSVGVVTTARLTHATPAAVYAKSALRHWENDASLPDGCTQQKDIAAQLVDSLTSGLIDVALGGGSGHFLPNDVDNPEGAPGKRTDGRNLVDELVSQDIQFVWNAETFARISLDGERPIFGLFEDGHMQFEYDRSGEPSLTEMTAAAILALRNNPDGFYLMVEAAKIDLANHGNNLHRTVHEGEVLAQAVALADALTDDAETLIIVTADHSSGIAFNGYCGRGSPVTGLCYQVDEAGMRHAGDPNLGLDGKPYTVVGYINGPGSVLKEQPDGSFSGSRPDLTNEQAMDPDYLQQALIPLPLEIHTGVDVALYAKGPWAHLFAGTIEQNVVFHVMYHAVTR